MNTSRSCATVNLRRLWTRGVLAGVLWLCLGGAAQADAIVFTDSASFQAALGSPAAVLDFEGVATGTQIFEGMPFGGITFTSNIGLGLSVASEFQTTSPTNYLGVDDRPDHLFLSGDELTFAFASPIQAFGLFIVGRSDGVLANDFQLVASGGSVFNVGAPEQILPDGSTAFFLGAIDPSGFGSAQLISFGDPDDPFFSFHIDDIATSAVPEPSSLVLLGAGLLAAGRRLRARHQRS